MDFDTDVGLVEAMLPGDHRAFDHFFTDYFPRLFRFAVARLGGNPDVAKDVVQASLIKAMRSLATFRGDAALFSWVCQICRHEISDYLRGHRRHTEKVLSIDSSSEGRAACAALVSPPELAPDAIREAEDESRATRAALDALPQNYRNALQWKYIEGRSVVEVAALLGLGPSASPCHSS